MGLPAADHAWRAPLSEVARSARRPPPWDWCCCIWPDDGRGTASQTIQALSADITGSSSRHVFLRWPCILTPRVRHSLDGALQTLPMVANPEKFGGSLDLTLDTSAAVQESETPGTPFHFLQSYCLLSRTWCMAHGMVLHAASLYATAAPPHFPPGQPSTHSSAHTYSHSRPHFL